VEVNKSRTQHSADMPSSVLLLEQTPGVLRFSGTLRDCNLALGTLRFRGARDFNGDVVLRLTVDDRAHYGALGRRLASLEITVAVAAVNDAPELRDLPGTLHLREGGEAREALRGLSAVHPDLYDDVEAEASLRVSCTTGTLSGTCGSWRYSRTSHVLCIGSLSEINSLLGSLSYFASAEHHGPDAISFTLDDMGNYGLGGPLNSSFSLAVQVQAVADKPSVTVPDPSCAALPVSNRSGVQIMDGCVSAWRYSSTSAQSQHKRVEESSTPLCLSHSTLPGGRTCAPTIAVFANSSTGFFVLPERLMRSSAAVFQGGATLDVHAGEHVQFIAEQPKTGQRWVPSNELPAVDGTWVPSIELSAAEGTAVLIHTTLLSSDEDGSEETGVSIAYVEGLTLSRQLDVERLDKVGFFAQNRSGRVQDSSALPFYAAANSSASTSFFQRIERIRLSLERDDALNWLAASKDLRLPIEVRAGEYTSGTFSTVLRAFARERTNADSIWVEHPVNFTFWPVNNAPVIAVPLRQQVQTRNPELETLNPESEPLTISLSPHTSNAEPETRNPQISNPKLQTPNPKLLNQVLEDTLLDITGISVSDPDAQEEDERRYTVTLFAGRGVFSLSSLSPGNSSRVWYRTGSGRCDRKVSFNGTLPSINVLLSKVSYLPDPDANGIDMLAVIVDDPGGASESPSRAENGVLIEIRAVNDPLILGDCLALETRRSSRRASFLALLACPADSEVLFDGRWIGEASACWGIGNTSSEVVQPWLLAEGSAGGCALGVLCATQGENVRLPLVQMEDPDVKGAPGHAVRVKVWASHGSVTVTHSGVTFHSCMGNCTSGNATNKTDRNLTWDDDAWDSFGGAPEAGEFGEVQERGVNGSVASASGMVVEFSGSLAQVNEALQNTTYTPSRGFARNDTITIEARDLDCCGSATDTPSSSFSNFSNFSNSSLPSWHGEFSFNLLSSFFQVPVLIAAGDSPPDIVVVYSSEMALGINGSAPAWLALYLVDTGGARLVELNLTASKGTLVLPLGSEDMVCLDTVLNVTSILEDQCIFTREGPLPELFGPGYATLSMVASLEDLNTMGAIGYIPGDAHLAWISLSVKEYSGKPYALNPKP